MPTVPQYNGLGVNPIGGAGGGSFAAPSGSLAGRQTQDAGDQMLRAGAAFRAAEEQADRVRVTDAMNQAVAARLKWTHDKDVGYQGLQGRAALERPDGKPLNVEYGEKLQQDISSIAATLGNENQRRLFSQQTSQLMSQFQGDLGAHLLREDRAYNLSTQEGTVKTAATQMGLEWDQPEKVAQGQGAIKAAVAEAGRLQGWAPEMVTAKQVDALSVAHTGVLTSAITAGKLDYAKAYMEQVKAEMTPQDRQRLQQHLQATDNAAQAIAAADEIWAKLGPKGDGMPVERDKMEAAARERFKDDPLKSKATIAEIQERASAFNASETERAAGNVNAVMLAYSKGAGLAALRSMPEFLALPGEKQAQIGQHVSDRQHMLWARSIEDRNRLEAEQAKRTYPAFLTYSDPNVLAGMSRQQVQALLPSLGNQLTEHLVQRWDTLQSKDARLQASVDQQDFEHFADQLGLKPFVSNKSEDQKRQLGELKFRVEQLIDQAQQVKKAPLDRQEKLTLMQQEMARGVAVDNSWWFGSKTMPIITMTPDQAKRVVVPQGDRQQIVQALQQMYERTKSQQYAPTEDNVRRLYLMRQSPAAGLIGTPNGQ